MTSLAATFERARGEGRAVLIGYFPAGFPDRERAKSIITAMVEGGVDIIEVGLPYSDPIMDGPIIQRATERAIANGFHTPDVFDAVAACKVPALVMSYWNPIAKYGVREFTVGLQEVNGVGVITPDLTVEESADWIATTSATGLERVYVVAPNTSDERLAQVAAQCSGFIYAASLMGVTGARSELSKGARDLVTRLRMVTKLPICVGLGISTRDQAREVAAYADGVIVGSAFIKLVLEATDHESALTEVRSLASELAQGVRGS